MSDGTEPPATLIDQAAASGLDVVALTDHDTTAGWAEAAARARSRGLAFVRGTEVSCSWGPISIHMLSYLHDPSYQPLADALAASRDSRDHRAQRMVERLRPDTGLTWAEVLETATEGVTVGRPHIADALVRRGVVADRSEAFATLLAASGPYYVPYCAPGAQETIEMIRAAGGVPIFAHPFAAARGKMVDEETIERFSRVGLAGVEVDHRDHTEADKQRLRGLAERFGLITTGSSDYHGEGKPNRLGENTTSEAVLAEIVSQGFLEVLR